MVGIDFDFSQTNESTSQTCILEGGFASEPHMPTTEAEKPPAKGDSAEQSGPQKQLERPSAHEIYKQVATSGREELKRSSTALGISGIAGGTFMGLTALGTALAMSLLGDSPGAQFISKMFYPIGFIVVMIGRAQLFTENTLYPVALVLAERRHLWNTLRLWSIVLPCNIVGALGFSVLAARTPGIHPGVLQALNHLGVQAISQPTSTVFWSGIFAGWLIAMAAWLVSGSHSVTGSILIIWLLTFAVGLGDFAHCIASSAEIFVAALNHSVAWSAYPRWLLAAVTGNICGGVGMVTLIEYGQVILGGEKGSDK